ncbi:MAG: membrane protein insertase YidC [Oscillospiraceae bacterium]|nr:membrane protein insertase YidC [Oscillospiraceae bacterium]
MGAVIDFLTGLLGGVMTFCYSLLNDYGFSIILFTLITKAVLFPLSIVTQKNSVKMVNMQPEIDQLKIKYIDDKDKFADEQLALYRKFRYNPFLDTLPLLIQLPIVLGLVGVVYKPLSYVLKLSDDVIGEMCALTGISETGTLYQLELIERINSGDIPKNISVAAVEAVRRITDFDMNFLGIDLGLTPTFSGNYILLLIPLLSGVSAWLLCYAQNKLNVLQLAQSSGMKIATTLFMVAFSTYFAFLVPSGVGLYWIFGNLFAIPLIMVTNLVIPPKKYVDYQRLERVREQKLTKEAEQKKHLKREKADYKRFFSVNGMKLMIYSESNGFYKYYEDMIDYICEKSDIQIHYVTSDPSDRIFDDKREQIIPYYIASDRYIVLLFMKLDCDMCIMTMPDLEKYHIKRSRVRSDIEYLYVCHGIGSNSLTMRKGALDWYDSMFCIGKYAENEVRQMEELYGTKPKLLVEAGYPLIDRMISDYEKMEKRSNEKPLILIAPSWQPDNIIELCGEELLDILIKAGFSVILRPHPQMVRHSPELFEKLHEIYDGTAAEIQTDFSSNSPILQADVLITDWSGIAYEFAFTTKRPVLFVNTPMKIMNEDYDKIAEVPMDITLRNVLGKSVDTDELEKSVDIINDFLENKDVYRDNIIDTLNTYVFNLGKSKAVYGRYVIKRLGG